MAAVWCFRLLWLYIPITLGYTFKEYFRRLRGLLSSVFLMIVWLFSFLPLAFVMMIIMRLIDDIFPQGSAAFILASALFQSVGYTLLMTVQTIAITHAIEDMMSKKGDRA